MNIKYNTITFRRDDYKEFYDTLHKYDYNYVAMWDDIRDFIRIAIRNGYQILVLSDEQTVMVEYNYKDESMSGTSIQWLSEDEYIEKRVGENAE